MHYPKINRPFTRVHFGLLDDVLLPLHAPNTRTAGRGGALPMTVSPAAIAKPVTKKMLLPWQRLEYVVRESKEDTVGWHCSRRMDPARREQPIQCPLSPVGMGMPAGF